MNSDEVWKRLGALNIYQKHRAWAPKKWRGKILFLGRRWEVSAPVLGFFSLQSWQENGFKSINKPRKFRPHWFSCSSETIYPIHLASVDGDKPQMLLGTSEAWTGAYRYEAWHERTYSLEIWHSYGKWPVRGWFTQKKLSLSLMFHSYALLSSMFITTGCALCCIQTNLQWIPHVNHWTI